MYFKDEIHEEQPLSVLDKFGETNIMEDVEYGTFAYLVGATYKAERIIQCIDENNNIDLDDLYGIIVFFHPVNKV